jgi:segregation and condensation protein A
MAAPLSYQIILPQFEGPFDLLLFFIERDELNIHDIPIFKITKEFLDYIHALEELNIEVASEFILVAATLMRIKAKMLLPRKDLDDQGKEIDPRQELVQKLLEYKQYKSVVSSLQQLEAERSAFYHRGNIEQEIKSILQNTSYEADLETVSLFRLFKSFHKVMDRFKDRSEAVQHRIIPYNYTIEEQKERLLQRMKKVSKGHFEQVFEVCENKMHAVFLFLAILELVQQQQLSIEVGEGFNNIWLAAA